MWFPYSALRRCPVPSGPYVAVINHLSHLDPPMAGLALRGPIRFLALDELWQYSRLLRMTFRIFGVIPIAREGRYPLRALGSALRCLKAGESVGLFPEGRRVRSWGEEPLSRGAAWLATRAGVPVIPVAIWGTQNAMSIDNMRIRRAPVRVVVGCPIHPDGFVECDDPVGALTESVRNALDRELRPMDHL